MKIAVLMACYNRVEMTLRSLETLYRAASSCEIDVFLVDDASPDATGAKVLARFPNVHVIQGTGDLYWSRAMNLAWKTAVESLSDGQKYDFFLWLNDDVALKADAIDTVMCDWDKCGDPHGVVVGVCSKDSSEAESSYSATTIRDRQLFPNGVSPQRADGWFNGNFVLVPWETYRKVGMISDEYCHSRGDYDYAERLKLAKVPFFASSRFVGVCVNDYFDKTEGLRFFKRISLLFKPGYWNVRDLFVFRRKYWGIGRAVISVSHLIVHVIFMRSSRVAGESR